MRKRWDSNPRYLAVLQFSRLLPSTARPRFLFILYPDKIRIFLSYQKKITSSTLQTCPKKWYSETTMENRILAWEAPQHEPFELGPRSRLIGTLILVAIIAYALISNSPLMAITFILVGVVVFLLQSHEPEIIHYTLTTQGLYAGRNFYRHDNVESFHLYQEEPFEDILSLHVNGALLSHVHISIPKDQFTLIRQTLRQYIPEEPHEPSLVDNLEKLLHI